MTKIFYQIIFVMVLNCPVYSLQYFDIFQNDWFLFWITVSEGKGSSIANCLITNYVFFNYEFVNYGLRVIQLRILSIANYGVWITGEADLNWYWGCWERCFAVPSLSRQAAYRLRLTAHRSPLTAHRSPLTVHCCPLIYLANANDRLVPTPALPA